MKPHLNLKSDSNGMTIVEIMIGIVLLSIVALGVTFFISAGTKTCHYAEDTIRVQQESQIVMNQLVSITMEGNFASAPVMKANGDVIFYVYQTDKTTKETTEQCIFFYQKSSQNLYYYELVPTTSDTVKNEIRSEINGLSSENVYGQLMGEYITCFEVKVANRRVSFQTKYVRNGKLMEVEAFVVMRNKIVKAVSTII